MKIMNKKQLLYSLLIVLVYGCQQTPSNSNQKDISHHLPSDFVMKYTDSMMRVYAETAYTGLVNPKNYKFPSAADFAQTINDVYHIDVKKSKFDNIYLSDDNGPVPIAIKQKNFIYVFDPLPDGPATVDSTLTFNLNNYLFNKNTKSRDWLLSSSNNKFYLFELVEKYYTNDEYLIKYVLDKEYKDENGFKELGPVIFTKKPNGRLEIKTDILKSIVTNTNQNDIFFARNILLYCFNLIGDHAENNFTDSEKAKIIAFASNSIDPIYQKYHSIHEQHWGTGSIMSHYMTNIGAEKWRKAEATFKKNKYYNLPELEKMINYAYEFDRIGAPD